MTEIRRQQQNDASRRWRQRNPERCREAVREYQKTPEGKEAWKRAKAKYLASPKGKAMRRRAMLKYHKSPKGHAVRKQAVQKYQKTEKGRTALKRTWLKAFAKRIALKRAVTIGDLTEIAKVYERCAWWKRWFDVEVDHIIPLARNGAHVAKNLQIIYQFENRRKHSKLDYKPRVIFT